MIKCRNCNSKSKLVRKKLRNNVKRNVYKCTNCTVEFLEPQKNLQAKLKKWYTKEYRDVHASDLTKISSNESQKFYDINEPLQHRRIIKYKKFLKKTLDVLDIGCATGYWLFEIKKYVKSVNGLELNSEHSNYVNKKLKIKCFNCEIKDLDKEKKYDLITFFQVFEHIPNPVEFINEVKKRLKPNGKILIELPNLNDPIISLDNNSQYLDFYYRKPHEFYYNKKSLDFILKKAGLVGKINGIHRYNFGNLLQWHNNKTPQDSSSIAMAENSFVSKNKELMKLISEHEESYKSFLEKKLLSESLFFIGTIK